MNCPTKFQVGYMCDIDVHALPSLKIAGTTHPSGRQRIILPKPFIALSASHQRFSGRVSRAQYQYRHFLLVWASQCSIHHKITLLCTIVKKLSNLTFQIQVNKFLQTLTFLLENIPFKIIVLPRNLTTSSKLP